MHKASLYRIESSCPVAVKCGGCSYRHISYEHELSIKKEYVELAFRKVGLSDVKISDTVSDMVTDGYRNKAQYPIARDDAGYKIGFYSSKTHRVIDALSCPLQPKIFSDICLAAKQFFFEPDLRVYNEVDGTGLLRHLYLRRAERTGEVLLTLVINGNTTGFDKELVSYFCERFPDVIGILLNINTDSTNVVLGRRYRTLWGRDHLIDELCGVELEIKAAAFYQVNHSMAQKLYRHARELAALSGNETVYDLYCGTGSIGLSMAEGAFEIVGVEIEPSAVECAIRNAKRAKINNARFYCADASSPSDILEAAGKDCDFSNAVVVIDPPRKGSSAELISYICEKSPLRVVYISCNPDTLARDSVFFRENGYKNLVVTPFDLFPRTGHVECVTVFERG